jgi:hypothetical protein
MALTRINSPASTIHISGWQLIYGLVSAGLVAIGLYVALVSAPAVRAAARAELQQAVTAETRAFCEKFGMSVGTAEFSACSQELAIVRRKQSDRDMAAAAGLI